MSASKREGVEKKATVARSHWGMVSTASPEATKAGVAMLELGGNAVDAAVAAAFCLGVTEPAASGLGGQSAALVHLAEPRRTFAVDGSSRAPFMVDPMRPPDKPLKIGLRATTVPSTPATLAYLLETYGRLKLATVLAPSIEAANEGFRATSLLHTLAKRAQAEIVKDPVAARLFLRDGKPVTARRRIVQPELAKCYERLAREGWQDFYRGAIADDIVADMKQRGGLISLADLHQIPIPQERPALEGWYRKFRIATFPPPGAGRFLVEILNILECFSRDEIDLDRPEAHVLLAHAFMHALRDRDQRPVDPDLYLQTRKKRMMDKRHAEGIAERIRKLAPLALPRALPRERPGGETTHLSVADAEGNVVGITQSIELIFGAKRANPVHGFLYNNYMSTFDYRDMTHPYYLLPGGSPWSSVAPTIVSKGRTPVLCLGSPGSERIATSLAQVISRFVDRKEGIGEAIASPRLHSSKAGEVQIEKRRFAPEVIEVLESAGFKIRRRGAYSFYLGCVQAVTIPTNRRQDFTGVADPRRDGMALGPEKVV